ncbi:MAG: YdcF family protein, partial [Pelosinus sp.]|nr:YdcF family protein [Pelosinus sp.]
MIFRKKLQNSILFIIVIIFFTVEIPIIAVGNSTQPEASDVMIVLGAKLIGSTPSTMLRLRLDEAVKLYYEGYAAKIIVSGAKGPDEAISEAQAMHDYLVAKGINPAAIFLEENSFNTRQNLTNSHAIMRQQHLTTAIIVSNASHIRRALVLAQTLGIKASGASAPMADNAYLTTKQYLREGAAMLAILFTK